VQAVAALRLGLFTGAPADVLVGLGDACAAEAKRALCGEAGTDLLEGPAEICVLADEEADADLVAADLVAQGEQGSGARMRLVTTSEALGTLAARRVRELIALLPEDSRAAAEAAWDGWGEVVLCPDREAMRRQSDRFAASRVEVHCTDHDWWLANLKCYGSLLLGEEAAASYGDACLGPCGLFSAQGAARHTAGLSVHTVLKVCAYQRLDRQATGTVAAAAARLCRLEGLEARARAADARIAKYCADAPGVLSQAGARGTEHVQRLLQAERAVGRRFPRDLRKPEALSPECVSAAHRLLASGRLHRYQQVDEVSRLEEEFAQYIGLPYAVGTNSGGCGLFLALRAMGVKPGDEVLVNAHTLLPVPSAVLHAGAVPVFVDSEGLAIDLKDLKLKAKGSTARVLLASYMRGRIPDMDALACAVKDLGLLLLEDCAHTLGAKWDQRHIGTFGQAAVWSFQTNKAINSGEGGVVCTRDPEVAAQLILNSGSYGHFALHGTVDQDLKVRMAQLYGSCPNFSMRLGAMAAAIARPQLRSLDDKVARWAQHMAVFLRAIGKCKHVVLHGRSPKDEPAWSSVQLDLPGFSQAQAQAVVERASAQNVPLAFFGGPWSGFTSTLKHWKFADPDGSQWAGVPGQQKAERTLLDVPLYHTAAWEESDVLALAELLHEIIDECAKA